jgi:hypothetical protein
VIQNEVLRLAMWKKNLKRRKMSNSKYYYNSNAQQNTNYRLHQVAEEYHTGDRLKEGTQMFILSSVQRKV